MVRDLERKYYVISYAFMKPSASGSHKAEINVLARAVDSCEAWQGRGRLLSSHGYWKNSVPCRLLDSGPQFLAACFSFIGKLTVWQFVSSKLARESPSQMVYDLCEIITYTLKPLHFLTVSFFFFFFFLSFSMAALTAYRGSQARGLIRAVDAGLLQSHSNVGSELCLRPTPQLTATQDR